MPTESDAPCPYGLSVFGGEVCGTLDLDVGHFRAGSMVVAPVAVFAGQVAAQGGFYGHVYVKWHGILCKYALPPWPSGNVWQGIVSSFLGACPHFVIRL